MKLNKKGQLALMINFIIVCFFVILVAAVFAPMGVLFNTKMYAAGEDIYMKANVTIGTIHDASVKARIYNMVSSGLGASENNIEVNNAIFQYSWIFILVLGALIGFLYTRRMVEYGYGGFI